MNPRILCDVDDVVADLLGEWLRRYNEDWEDKLPREDVTGWDITQFVKPKCGNRVYEILGDPDFYETVNPIPGAIRGVEQLRRLGRVVFVTSSNTATMAGKVHWLERWGFLPDQPRQSDLIFAHDKSLIRGDMLIDDGAHNISAFPGHTILFDQYHNRDTEHPRRARTWDEVVSQVETILA